MPEDDFPPPLTFPSARRWRRVGRPPVRLATVALPGEEEGPCTALPGALRRMMEERGLSQSDLSRRTGVPQPKISEYLSGRTEPTLSTLGKLLEGMGATARELVEAMEEAE